MTIKVSLKKSPKRSLQTRKKIIQKQNYEFKKGRKSGKLDKRCYFLFKSSADIP